MNGFTNLLISISVLIVLGYAISKIDGIRGTDQFWYHSDTEQLAQNWKNTANTIWAGEILRQGTGDPVTHFPHNGPLLYVNAVITKFVGAFHSWKFTNLIWAIIAATLTALVIRKYTNTQFAIYGFALYILSPLNVWLSTNLVQEPFFAFLFSVQCYVVLAKKSDNIIGVFALYLATILGVYSHPFFAVTGLAAALAIFISHSNNLKRIWLAGSLVLFVVIAQITKRLVFSTTFPPDIITLIRTAIPGESPMLWHYTDALPPFTLNLILDKFLHLIAMQFSDIRILVLSIVTYASILSAVVLVVLKPKKYSPILLAFGLAVSLYFAIVLLMQYQFRYQQIVAPLVCIVIFCALFELRNRFTLYAVATLFAIFLAIDIKLIDYAANDIDEFAQATADFGKKIDEYPTDIRLVFFQKHGYAPSVNLITRSEPRKSLAINTAYLSEEQIDKVLELFTPDWAFSHLPGVPEISGDSNYGVIPDLRRTGTLYFKEVN